jgi:4-oxalocrotonate tautomerase
MPYATISMNSSISAENAQSLSQELIRLLVEDLGKDADLSVVRVANHPSALHLADGGAPAGLSVVEVHITAGTTTAEQQAAFIAHTHSALQSRGLGGQPSYVIVHQHDAQAWGYGGATQATRQVSSGDG